MSEMYMHDKKFLKINRNDTGGYLGDESGKMSNLYFCELFLDFQDFCNKYVLTL